MDATAGTAAVTRSTAAATAAAAAPAAAADARPAPHRLAEPAALELRGVTKGYGATQPPVLQDVHLRVGRGEFVAIVGFSGSGKTTLVGLLAGLIRADGGDVLKDGHPIAGPGPDRGIVFQNYSLMPWLTVRGNVALAVDKVFAAESAAARAGRVAHYVKMVGLSAAIDKLPAQLSGGMRQRVGLARALAGEPDVLLLDEPLSALDALTRATLQDEIVRIREQDRKTVLLITNDVDEALMMADRIVALDIGPAARLGPDFEVDIARPRDRRAMNHDPRFQQLRRDITRHLLGLAQRRDAGKGADVIPLPALTPRDLAGTRRPSLASLMRLRHAARLQALDDDAGSRAAAARLAGSRGGEPSPAARSGDNRFVEFSRVVKTYAGARNPVTVVDGFDLRVARGEFISVIGHSGCGKSTILSMIAGLTGISDGVIVLDGREIDGAGPDRGLVFQSPSLVPWLTVHQNVMLGVQRVFPQATPTERENVVAYYLGRVGLGGSMHKRADELSSGMRQRVGIARAFALDPKLLLLDEPFGMLDSLTRWELQAVLMDVWARNRLTAIMVTHDVDEALLLADRVVMMSNGPRARIGQVLEVPLPRPRTREALLAHPRYYELREAVIGFLEDCGRQG